MVSIGGLDHIRQPESDDATDLPLYPHREVAYPLHGHGAHQPATLIGHGIFETGDRPHLWCEGEVVQSMMYRGALRLRRRIEMPLGGAGPHHAVAAALERLRVRSP